MDDDKAQCPAAQYTKIQAAVDAAANGDVVAICAGTYVEGIGAGGTNAVLVSNKSIDIRGAGADLVAIQPKRTTATGGRILELNPDLRNGVGDVISVVGTRAFPVTVNISGVTVDGNGVYVEAGVVYRDAGGTLLRDRVTNIVTSESNTADSLDGGYRSNFTGVGIADVTGGGGTVNPVRPALNITQSRVSRYNRIGVLIDSATGDTPPLTQASGSNGATPPTVLGITNSANLVGNQIVGRTQCTAFNTPTPPPYVLGPNGTPALNLPGNCTTVSPTTVGPTFGQDGVRVAAGSTVTITDNTISANVVHGTGAPAQGSATNNANLSMGAGVRLIGAGASTISKTNLTDNAYGVFNTGLNGTTPNTAVPVKAENNFWGLQPFAAANVGPAISPTTNPPYQESAVNGTATPDATCVTSAGAAVAGSDAVDFCPFRNGNQADPGTGELPVAYAPLPISDVGPTISLGTASPTYDAGAPVSLQASATDDFGVAKLTFYQGTTPVGTAVPPASSTTFTVPATAACGSLITFTAVATDSSGQTASSTTSITVAGPTACPVAPPAATATTVATATTTPTATGTATPTATATGTATATAAPTGTVTTAPTATATATPPPADNTALTLTGVPTKLGAKGATIGATLTDTTKTLSRVAFKLGTRTVCTDTSAPYSCKVVPRGREVGDQAVLAIGTDTAGGTVVASGTTRVRKFPSTVSLSIKKRNTPDKLIRKVGGAVSFSSQVSQRQGCGTGTLNMTVKENGKTVFPLTEVPLSRDCTFAQRFTVARSTPHRFRVAVQFGGNAVLTTANAKRSFK